MKSIIAVIAIASAVILSGCSSVFGESEYACKGMENGVLCAKPGEIYQMTNHRDKVIGDETGRPIQTGTGGEVDVNGKSKGDGKNRDNEIAATDAALPSRLLEPLHSPQPVLEPASVMRIWVAPWIDTKGDAHYPSLVFTEITPRRWSFGEVAGTHTPILTPLQIDNAADAATGNEEPITPQATPLTLFPPAAMGRPGNANAPAR